MNINITKKFILILPAIIILVIGTIILLYLNGFIILNNPSRNEYPVRGIDVSEFQGDIDWNILSKNDISFAFIKATEGSSSIDSKFKENWENVQKTNLIKGAYHFFSFESSGKTQAENFIKTVPKDNNSLPPVIDIEFYSNIKNINEIKDNLKILVEELEDYYKKPPILYVTYDSYKNLIKNNYDKNPIWIRDIITKPHFSDNHKWTFWQYTDKGHMNGYNGKERFIDMNVFNGSIDDLNKYL